MMTRKDSRSRFVLFLFYCLPAVPLAAMGILFFVHLPKFHTSTLGVGLSVVSFALLFSRIWDAFTDPAIGYLSDRISKPFFRRPAWVIGGGILCSLIFLWVCSSQLMGVFGTSLVGYVVLSVLFFLFYTVLLIPYESWALEIFEDAESRTRIIMLREGATLLGTLLAGTLPFVFGLRFEKQEEVFFWVGITLAIFLAVSSILVVLLVPFPRVLSEQARPKGIIVAVQEAFRIHAFRTLLFAFCLTTIAAQIPAALILFFVEDVLQIANPALYVLLYFVGAGIGFPFWLRAARSINKVDLWSIGVLMNTVFFFFVLFIPSGGALWYSVCVVCSGLGLGGIVAIPTAIQADIVEYDAKVSGERREGSFVGIWSIVRKLSAAIGVAAVLHLLATYGYDPEIEQEVTSALQSLIRGLYCLVPCVINLTALFFIFPLREELEELFRE